MGIGLVDPILPVLAEDLQATPSQVSLLFTSYFAMTGVSMLVTGWVASRIGPRRRCSTGLALVVVFSALAGLSSTVFQIAGFRIGWGVGNALFIATALSVIVGSATGGLTSAIILYEAALGLGIASGPLLGGLLGNVSWRGPFFGTAVLMAIGFVLISVLLGPIEKPAKKVSIADPLRALAHPGLRSMAIVAVFYNFGFFTILAYTPLLLGMSALQLGFIYFGWGLLVALTSVFGAQRLERRFGLVAVLGVTLALVAVDLFAGGVLHASQGGLIVVVVVSGAPAGHRQHRPHRGGDGRRGGRAPDRLRRLQLRALHRRRDRARSWPASSPSTSRPARRCTSAPAWSCSRWSRSCSRATTCATATPRSAAPAGRPSAPCSSPSTAARTPAP